MITRKTLKTKYYLNPKDFVFKPYHKILKKPKKLNEYLKDSEKLLAAFLIRKIASGPYFSMGYREMAAACGISVSSLKRALKKFVEMGLIVHITLKESGSFIMRCVFKISDYFTKDWVIRRAKGFFAAAILLPVVLLFSINLKHLQSEYDLRLKEEKKYILRNNIHTLKKETQNDVVVKKRKRKMSYEERVKYFSDIFSEIAKVERVKFTKRGFVELTKYPPEALAHLNEQLKFASGNIRNLQGWIFSLLNKYVKANDLAMDFEAYNRFMKASKFTGNEPILESNELKTTTTKKSAGQNGMYTVYKEEEREELPIEVEIRKWEEFECSPKGKAAKMLGILCVPPRVKEYRRLHSLGEVE